MALSITISAVTETSFSASVRTSGSVAMQHNWQLNGVLYDSVQTSVGETFSRCSFTGLKPGTSYQVKVAVYAFNPWRELDSGTTNVTTEEVYIPPEPEPQRPEDWYWESLVSSGAPLSMTASEWNRFLSRIKEFAEYENVTLSSAALSSAIAGQGDRMLASQANAARMLISRLSPRTSVPSEVSSGDPITASFMNGLKNALNSIP